MLTLSEAIRLGAMLHPQGFEHYRAYDQHAQIVTCAIGAAEDAGWTEGEAGICAVVPKGCCPVGVCGYQSDGAGLIIHLNDTHQWTREAIADWVETQEHQQAVRTTFIETPQPVLA